MPPPSRSGVPAPARHIVVVSPDARSLCNKDGPCSRLRVPAALYAFCSWCVCVRVCVCAGDTKPFERLCWCFITDGREGRKGKETSSCILHRTVVRACGLWICAVCCCIDFPKRNQESGWGWGRDGGEPEELGRLTNLHTRTQTRTRGSQRPLTARPKHPSPFHLTLPVQG